MAIGVMTRNFDSGIVPWGNKLGPAHPESMSVTYVGRVLETRERNGYDDSDFYALVWDDETESVKTVEYATTRGWTYPNWATVDATDEVKAKAAAFYAEAARKRAEAEAAEEAKVPRKGKTVRVVKGRKIPIGTVAEVGWFGEDKFRRSRYRDYRAEAIVGFIYSPWDYRVGLRINGEMVFTSAENVEVLVDEEATV